MESPRSVNSRVAGANGVDATKVQADQSRAAPHAIDEPTRQAGPRTGDDIAEAERERLFELGVGA